MHGELTLLRIDSAHGQHGAEPGDAGFLAGKQFFRVFRRGLSGKPAGADLAQKRRGAEEKSEELKDLQAFNQDIIESMRGGLLTTDLKGEFWW